MKTIYSISRDLNGNICYIDSWLCYTDCDTCNSRFRCYTEERFILEDDMMIDGVEHLRRLFGDAYDEMLAIADNTNLLRKCQRRGDR